MLHCSRLQFPVRRWASLPASSAAIGRRASALSCAPSDAPQQQAVVPEVLRTSHSRSCTPEQLQQLNGYLDYLLEINQSMNLTAVRDPAEAWQRHVEDSLALLPAIEAHMPSASSEHVRAIDVGTGPGLPGMVLAIARPNWKVTLLDSLRKRCDFMQQAADRIGLKNIRVVWSRAEEAGQDPELREAYDLAVARAVAEMRVLAELCLPFVRVGGLWVAAKGPEPQAEVSAASNALGQCGGKLLELHLVGSHSPEGQRTAVVVAKARPTPKKFPRQPGTPGKKPL